MVTLAEHYDAYPYPERDPSEERRRLITGSPSHPLEMDHALWGGARDWSRPLRALVAGGGTGDGLIQLAQVLKSAGAPAEITYLDLSASARRVAEERARVRGLDITFRTGSLLEAGEHGPFDYIDCCGVLHHLDDPEAGFRALRAALAPGGGMGMMVYAPYGRSGVYPLQEAFGAILGGLPPEERLNAAKGIMGGVPQGHPFRSNPNLVDHAASDAGFYDLLLHGQDRPYSVTELLETFDATGWQLARFAMPGLYDLGALTPHGADLPERARMAAAEKLRGTIKTHIAYAVPEGAEVPKASVRDTKLVPHLRGLKADAAARAVAAGKPLPLRLGSETRELSLPKGAAPLLGAIDGRRSVAEISATVRLDPIAAASHWGRIEAALAPWGLMLLSGLLRRR
ncbi:methyltransferase [Roseivivax halodurans JCM 10272]|uniref:Methyltransferase n=1 Tax=Roseivivax halodurans JCM 10272 TaxID=1449350 RepID=X7ED41_9RHOB|nr:class I SAM-dependent methyltransferase [Roseivivax halodurans]ETX13984.1 methyltransferase [Roseivivax halodurans JCM 10272]